MLAEEGEGLGDLGIPRRQRGSRRRLSFDRMTHEPVYERPRSIERHTSGIYDLIDAIGLLGRAPAKFSCRRRYERQWLHAKAPAILSPASFKRLSSSKN